MTAPGGALPLFTTVSTEPAPAPAGRSRPGVRYLRRPPADDCAGCWADQHAASVAGRPVPMRARATWVREQEDPCLRGYQTGPTRVARTPMCPGHKADRETADRAAGRAS